jgi:hypothetical protein
MTESITPTQHSSLVGGSTSPRRKKASEITPEEVRALLLYAPDTGLLFWRVRSIEWFSDYADKASLTMKKWNTRWAGKPALGAKSNGYLTGHINRVQVYAHRIAWTYYHNEQVAAGMYIDHINGDRTDNRITNLRTVTPQQSSFNMPPRSQARQLKGVKYDARRGHWYARIRIDGVDTFLGRFPSADAAAAAYKKAAERYQGDHAYHISRQGNVT